MEIPPKQNLELDQLNLKNDSSFKLLLEQNQQIILSSFIWKYNNGNKCQGRIIVLTNKAILNVIKSQSFIKSFFKKIINPFNLRRRIPLSSLYGISLTSDKSSNTFIIHVNNQHDYHYKAKNNKIQLLRAIAITYNEILHRDLSFYFKDQVDIMNSCTLKVHLKEKKQVKPKENPVFISNEYFSEKKFTNKVYICDYSIVQNAPKPVDFSQIEQINLNDIKSYYILHEQFNRSIKVANIYNSQYLLKPSFSYLENKEQLIFTPLMAGGNIKNFLKQMIPLQKQALIFYISLLILIIEQLHSQNIVYSNLSLENILVKKNGYLVLTGLQKSIKKLDSAKPVFDVSGNPHYTPPEVISCQGYGPQIDLWKLGICAYFLFTGHFPFSGANLKTLYLEIVTKPLENEHLPDFIGFLLEKDVSKRIKILELKQTSFFKNVQWCKLKRQEVKAPFEVNELTWSSKLSNVFRLRNEPC